eukprot:5253496-Pyramimonas_sp.AAC.1
MAMAMDSIQTIRKHDMQMQHNRGDTVNTRQAACNNYNDNNNNNNNNNSSNNNNNNNNSN